MLNEALAAQKEAQKEYDLVVKPILDDLHTTEAYQEARRAADQALAAIRALRQANSRKQRVG